jgi:hypothetical protein
MVRSEKLTLAEIEVLQRLAESADSTPPGKLK